ncbi:AraC family transcriptional regulator [Tahibacter amnicola]|uniref:AraC family transcriptional regulator n=1 Tax=Tahibacter amnicola TaxID=2976241 RepID=A0ABY6BG11_9GAMM|nr:AraC family transcriptional regulator [Tahibacter amnicola]UXI68963.1 AraC family transcriptional regulator [Tahibacter amnicola]
MPSDFAATDALAGLRRRILGQVDTDGIHATAVPSLSLIRASEPSLPLPSVYQPSLCLVVQGRKHALLGQETFVYDAMNYLVVSVTLPVVGQIIKATPEEPYLCLRIEFDPAEVLALAPETAARRPSVPDARGLFVARVDAALLDAVVRLVGLLDAPSDIPVLAPLVLREVCYRVLVGEQGHRLSDATGMEGHAHRIARAIGLLKHRYAEPLRIEELAQVAHMSPSALHHRFKAVTSLSPLQYQKRLRLHEARRLMLAEGLEAASAAHRVGYESPSQFSREYRRMFGAPPRREVGQLRVSGEI